MGVHMGGHTLRRVRVHRVSTTAASGPARLRPPVFAHSQPTPAGTAVGSGQWAQICTSVPKRRLAIQSCVEHAGQAQQAPTVLLIPMLLPPMPPHHNRQHMRTPKPTCELGFGEEGLAVDSQQGHGISHGHRLQACKHALLRHGMCKQKDHTIAHVTTRCCAQMQAVERVGPAICLVTE